MEKGSHSENIEPDLSKQNQPEQKQDNDLLDYSIRVLPIHSSHLSLNITFYPYSEKFSISNPHFFLFSTLFESDLSIFQLQSS
jgi:hypothetical protein